MNTELQKEINLIETLIILIILLISLYFQFFFHEEPCPLCLSQRWGLLGVAFAFLLNVKYGMRPSHYGIALLSAIFAAAVAVRQILLHIVPGTGNYGPPVWGWHLYTWVFIISFLIIISISLMLIYDKQFQVARVDLKGWLYEAMQIVFILTIIISLLNCIATFSQCGFLGC